MSTQTRKNLCTTQIAEDSESRVLLTTIDQDRFIRTQREVVEAVRSTENMVATMQGQLRRLQDMVTDVVAWCKGQSKAECVVFAPRSNDIIAVVVCADEDEAGQLDEAIAQLDLNIHAKYGFHMTWIMLRKAEAAGIQVFAPTEESTVIYRAK